MKSPRFLRFIIVYKAAAGVSQLALSLIFLRALDTADIEASLKRFLSGFGIDIENSFIQSAVTHASMFSSSVVFAVTIVIILFGVLNLVESYGLHLKQRWAEWLTVIATSLLIPLEIYEVLRAATAFKAAILVINCVIVYYLAKHKELFKPRGASV